MMRSKRYVFVSFCLLCQGVRATGIVRKYPAVVKPVVNILIDLNINIVQMPCPELSYDTLHRRPCGKSKYNTPQNRAICQKISGEIANFIKILKRGDNTIQAILGIDFSPSCAVNLLAAPPPRRRINGQGIFIEELNKTLHNQGIKIPFLGINPYDIEKTLKELINLFKEDIDEKKS